MIRRAAFAGPLAALALSASTSYAQESCGAAQESVCRVSEGEYLIRTPTDVAGPIPAVVFLHGWQSSGAGVLSNAALVEHILDRGYALIAPNGMRSDADRSGGSWSFHPERPEQRDEAAFLDAVLQDAAERHGINPEHAILSGFSIGGSMASYVACEAPDLFSAYAPLGGMFWRPHPAGCAGPVRLFHTHGWTDVTVPLEGRYVADGALAQGDIFHGLEVWRETNGCDAMRADAFVTEGAYWRRKWERCAPGSALELALFPGGHVIPRDWAPMMIDWYEGL